LHPCDTVCVCLGQGSDCGPEDGLHRCVAGSEAGHCAWAAACHCRQQRQLELAALCLLPHSGGGCACAGCPAVDIRPVHVQPQQRVPDDTGAGASALEVVPTHPCSHPCSLWRACLSGTPHTRPLLNPFSFHGACGCCVLLHCVGLRGCVRVAHRRPLQRHRASVPRRHEAPL
jgi:hypothetical protein